MGEVLDSLERSCTPSLSISFSRKREEALRPFFSKIRTSRARKGLRELVVKKISCTSPSVRTVEGTSRTFVGLSAFRLFIKEEGDTTRPQFSGDLQKEDTSWSPNLLPNQRPRTFRSVAVRRTPCLCLYTFSTSRVRSVHTPRKRYVHRHRSSRRLSWSRPKAPTSTTGTTAGPA